MTISTHLFLYASHILHAMVKFVLHVSDGLFICIIYGYSLF